LIGSALGVRGQAKLGGTFNYDVFVGKPLKKPQGFRTSEYTYGVNLGYSF
jgi:hemolysin activation/secretion protein